MIVNVCVCVRRSFVCRSLVVVVVVDHMLLLLLFCIYCLTRVKKYTCTCKLILYISPKSTKSLQLCGRNMPRKSSVLVRHAF